ncbi:conjugative transposon protein TraM [Mucilaginibacter gynuensis]|uniref:Conjugative transposon protein TraM n=1 Tax=Mucilaginibacter gynuensis TaxID=1302236 RepID=A0ABP8GZ02_9SPHI
MKIDFKQPRYVLPILALPFISLFFYVWKSSFANQSPTLQPQNGFNGTVVGVASGVRQRELSDKLDAYRDTYKNADGYSVVNVIPKETSGNPAFHDNYTFNDHRTLDSLDEALKAKYGQMPFAQNGNTETNTPDHLLPEYQQRRELPLPPREKDPMEVFKQQIAYMDSLTKVRDMEAKVDNKELTTKKAQNETPADNKLSVTRESVDNSNFNTVRPVVKSVFITAVIDENITGYAGSRLRLKLLEEIRAGSTHVKKGTYIFAQISGFSEQRVTLVINTILADGVVLPVRLEVYDLDGLPGLYVPSSAFREFTRELGSNSVQGVTIDGNNIGSQFIMSSVDKLFQSTSSAIAGLIRKNKAKMKYNSYVYLFDPDMLQKMQ